MFALILHFFHKLFRKLHNLKAHLCSVQTLEVAQVSSYKKNAFLHHVTTMIQLVVNVSCHQYS